MGRLACCNNGGANALVAGNKVKVVGRPKMIDNIIIMVIQHKYDDNDVSDDDDIKEYNGRRRLRCWMPLLLLLLPLTIAIVIARHTK